MVAAMPLVAAAGGMAAWTSFNASQGEGAPALEAPIYEAPRGGGAPGSTSERSEEKESEESSKKSEEKSEERGSGEETAPTFVNVLVLTPDEKLVAHFSNVNLSTMKDEGGKSSLFYSRLGGEVITTEKMVSSAYPKYPDSISEELFVRVDEVSDEGHETVAEKVSKREIYSAMDGSNAIYVYLGAQGVKKVERWIISPYEEKSADGVVSHEG